jgi:hypothetical protein
MVVDVALVERGRGRVKETGEEREVCSSVRGNIPRAREIY